MKAADVDWNDPGVFGKINAAQRLFNEQRENERRNRARRVRAKRRKMTRTSQRSNR